MVPIPGTGILTHSTSTVPDTEPIKAVTFAFLPTCIEVLNVKFTFAIPFTVLAELAERVPLLVIK